MAATPKYRPVESLTPRQAYRRGVKHAADLASGYNGTSSHPYDLGDCILGKLNMLPKSQLRRNTRKPAGFDAGVALVLVELIQAHDLPSVAADIMKRMGYTPDDLKCGGADAKDMRVIRKAWRER